MKTIIQHQTQPCEVSCVTTCMAMLLGEPVDTLMPVYHQAYREGKTSLRTMLLNSFIPFTEFSNLDERALNEEGVYLVTVPSLNIVGGLHQILVEVTDEAYFVLDPVKGREDKYYTERGRGDGQQIHDLNGFVIDAHIPRYWLEGKQK